MKEQKKTPLRIVEKDPWLEPNENDLIRRHERYCKRLEEIETGCGRLLDFANAPRWYGFNYSSREKGWWFREWLPGAKDVYLFGDFNGWDKTGLHLDRDARGNWSIFLPDELYADRLTHGSKVKMLVHGENGWQERIPAYIRRVVQHEETKNFNGQFWNPPQPFDWQEDTFVAGKLRSLFIYEAHVGMAQEKEGLGTYLEFIEHILPRIQDLGYNAIQLMAIAEHPYYGSFGYHVSNFFAPSSKFGTPEELKLLVRTAHRMGIAVIMDVVHSHYVKNIHEGLNELDGTDCLYSPPGPAGNHPHWDSKLFDYSKEGVQHFLLSNLKYWMEEFHFDGFRFDGVTSMAYYHHGYTEFDDRSKYFGPEVNEDALLYLTLANRLVHDFNPEAVTIAEDVSGMPGMCVPIGEGGIGFDYRLAMAEPDFWIKLLKEKRDEEWDIRQMWEVMTNRLPGIGTIAYCESHDQALVGDKTLAFRLMDQEMYENMNRAIPSVVVDRGMALHKMIRLFTIALGGDAYLNFMGNEFGHPEWIDFPRAGNNWSYAYARRQWSLASNGFLRYSYLNDFDRDMIHLFKKYRILEMGYAWNLLMDDKNQTIVFNHDDLVFVFNWHPQNSLPDYPIEVPFPGRYKVLMSTDSLKYGGPGRLNEKTVSFSYPHDFEGGVRKHYMQVYNVNRCATVYKRMKG
ncbi:MAG: alpha amylase C-terminal domain-containing protein [Rikenellaceae bacterium]|nr:alpha amylase C-terminal domain-containing protein [Rikenellaceae bacterium]